MTMTGGTIGGSDTITVSGLLTWNGGTAGGTGAFNASGGINMVAAGGHNLDTRTLKNAGTATLGASSLTLSNGAVFNNLASGTFDAQGNGSINTSGSPPGSFTNVGTFQRSTSSGTFVVYSAFTNTGAVNCDTGTLQFNGTFTQTAGGTHLVAGNLATNTTLNVQGGVLDGNGIITGNVSVSGSGQFSPGNSPGEISITGNYTQAAPAVLNIDINGKTSPGVDYDDILISAAANLGGTLAVNLGYTPALGDSFTILTHASRTGTFGTLNFPSPGPGLGWDVSYTNSATKLTIAQLLATLMRVDARAGSGTVSNANGVLEPGETVQVEPTWTNMTESAIATTGTASDVAGPPGATYALTDTTGDYGTANADSAANCFDATGNCYTVSVSAPAARPATHWDATFKETLTGGTNKTWTLHVGDSFTDVPRSQAFYTKIETLLHTGITAGCTATKYCPGDNVSRGQMAIFIGKGVAGGGANIPTSGLVGAKPYNCVAGGTSIFTDVLPTDIYCKHIHYIAASNVTLGCSATQYCPAGNVTRLEMAAFIAKAVVAPAGGAGVPISYGPDPVTGFSYNCNTFGSNIHFTDVPASNSFCKHVHYLWARGIISGISPTQYGPSFNVTRDAMAKFLSNAFNLLLYGPVP
jgi:hypothetical protein